MFFCNDKHSYKNLRPFVIAASLSLVTILVPAASFAGVETDPNLLKLEMKFFQHDYSKEDAAARLSRIEKMVFGESKSGDPATRLKNLVAAVPNLNEFVDQGGGATASGGADNAPTSAASSRSGRAPSRSVSVDDELAQRESQITGSSQYPQVSAMERKLFSHDYASEPIAKRLERLESKVFGRASQSDDLSDRVDQLKARTGVDLAATPPPGTDWADDDDMPRRGGGDVTYVPAQTTPFSGSRTPATNLGGGSPIGGGSGGYGMGAPSASASDGYTRGGSYGYNPPRRVASAGGAPRTAPPAVDDGDMPRPAPDVVREPAAAPPAAMGLNQRVSLMENEIFKKTYTNDTLPARISRLEGTVFPGRKTAPDMSLPERVSRLYEVVGIVPAPTRSVDGGSRVAQRPPVDDLGDDASMPRPAPSRSGISKIIGGLGSLLTGGGYGAYPMGGSNLMTDPSTGMLVDMYSGSIIDPRTGAVVGNRATGIRPGTYGALPYSGFGNGLSPMGSGYGMSSGLGGMRFGSGMGMGSGMRGFGGMGMGSGMGFGSGMGMGMGMPGMGVWP